MQAKGRRSIRLPDYDYSSPGAYFVTIATKLRQPLFGVQHGEDVILNDHGRLATRCWQGLPKHFSQLILDAFIVMPNHVHGILFIHEVKANVGAQHAAPLRQDYERVLLDERELDEARNYILHNPLKQKND